MCVLPHGNLYRSLYRLRSPGFKRSELIKEIKRNGDEEKSSFRGTKISAGRC